MGPVVNGAAEISGFIFVFVHVHCCYLGCPYLCCVGGFWVFCLAKDSSLFFLPSIAIDCLAGCLVVSPKCLVVRCTYLLDSFHGPFANSVLVFVLMHLVFYLVDPSGLFVAQCGCLCCPSAWLLFHSFALFCSEIHRVCSSIHQFGAQLSIGCLTAYRLLVAAQFGTNLCFTGSLSGEWLPNIMYS